MTITFDGEKPSLEMMVETSFNGHFFVFGKDTYFYCTELQNGGGATVAEIQIEEPAANLSIKYSLRTRYKPESEVLRSVCYLALLYQAANPESNVDIIG